MSDKLYSSLMDVKQLPKRTHPGHVVVRCAWCWMFGEERKGKYEHIEKPLTRHPFVPYQEVISA